ncbi:hypothetical protein EYF80_028018 [Liparis tanakae]|uniref:Uncharacterized protein n=1 Tax=Liparis tanakae TaxID=230148 RepID=A0A4Z2H7Q1_9TELE|nr:hypothetical protein EYF80_028018 [Liparis tanakae]
MTMLFLMGPVVEERVSQTSRGHTGGGGGRAARPELGLASIEPVVLRGATRACGPRPVELWAAAEPDPEVSVSGLQLLDEPLHQPLLALRFDAEQVASVRPAGPPGILEAQPPPAVLDVGHLVARALRPTPADPLAWR